MWLDPKKKKNAFKEEEHKYSLREEQEGKQKPALRSVSWTGSTENPAKYRLYPHGWKTGVRHPVQYAHLIA